MNDKVKNYVGVALIIALLAVGIAALEYVSAYRETSSPTAYRSFAVSGEGKVVGVPDVARFNFSVVTEGGMNVAQLQTDNTTKVNKALDFIKKQGVAAGDIKTDQYQIEPRYQYSPRAGTPPAIVGYTISQTVRVKVHTDQFAKLGDLLTGVVTSGANQVSQLSFEVDDPAALEAAARGQAIAQARSKAAAAAKAGGFNLGRLLSIDEGGGYLPMAKTMNAYGLGGSEGGPVAAPAPTIEPGSQEVNVQLTLRYEIR